MLFYKKLVKDLTEFGFELNPYDPCVANKMVNRYQMTVSWHVDDLKISHIDSNEVTKFIEWIKEKYGSIGEVNATRGKIHEYLGMKLDYSVQGQVTVDMQDYVTHMIKQFPKETLDGKKVSSPWNDNLFKFSGKSPPLNDKMREQFHTTTAQGLFLSKWARPDISPAIAYLTTRVKSPNVDDWEKLVRMMKFLIKMRKDCLTLRADNSNLTGWYIDSSFAVHPDMKSHTGAGMTLGKGFITNISRKQNENTRSST
jgi:hypothetical protein